MDIAFDKGSRDKPKGHALLYFRSSFDHEEVWATYLVILPITVDVSKYVPPFLMNQMGDIGPKDLSAFAFPPAPEKVEGYKRLENLAEARDDDILFGGTANLGDVPMLMMMVNEALQSYGDLYSQAVEPELQDAGTAEEESGLGVNEVLYQLMSDSDKLGELTKLVGRLKYASEVGEKSLSDEAEHDIRTLAKHLPENHQVARLIEAAKSRDARSNTLTDLWLKRCFYLMHEKYVELGKIEEEIRALESGEASA
ncbi:MAG: hypothetical protein L0177_20205 [Chloroflexi bacterium]|nr:hypothetical protein [Chloroflexota bacterium]